MIHHNESTPPKVLCQYEIPKSWEFISCQKVSLLRQKKTGNNPSFASLNFRGNHHEIEQWLEK